MVNSISEAIPKGLCLNHLIHEGAMAHTRSKWQEIRLEMPVHRWLGRVLSRLYFH
jgi:hypothetical protein